MKRQLIRGIVPVLSTPLLDTGEVDEQGLARLVDYLAARRIGGLWVLGTGSEDMNLTFAQRLVAARVASEAAKGRVPIVLGAGFFAMRDILDFMEQTSDLVAEGMHVMPYHPLLSLERLEWFYTTLAERCPKPLWMYTSGNWSRHFPPAFMAKMKGTPNIAGVKYSTRTAPDVLQVAALADENFQVITAVASQTYSCLCMGSKAHTSSLASCVPEPLIDIYDLFEQGRHEEALAAQLRFNEFLAAFTTGAKKDNFLSAAEEKYVLSRRGICGETVSSYYRGLTSEEKERIDKALDTFGYLGP